MRQLTSLDAQFLAMENDRVQGHVSVLGIYDPQTAVGRPLDAARVRELISERLHLLPTFRWRLAQVPFSLDYPYWVDDGTFDVEYHVRELALPSPGNQRQLAEQVARIIGRQLDRSRPLWEVYVIHGLEDGGVAVLTKMHHAAVDGVSGAEVMSILLDDTTGKDLQPARTVAAEPFPSEMEMLGRGLVGLMSQPLRVMRAGPTALPHLDDVPTIRHLPGVKAIARSSRLIRRSPPRCGQSPTRHRHLSPSDPFPGTRLATPTRRIRLVVTDHGQGDQEHVRLHRQRRGDGHLHRRPSHMVGRAGRASRRTARRLCPDVGPHARTEGNVR